MGDVREVSESDFSSLLTGNGAVLVDFWADWCGPCKMMAPVLESISERFGDRMVVAKVNVDTARQLASTHGIMSIPTLILFKDGQPAERFVGYMGADDLAARLEQSL